MATVTVPAGCTGLDMQDGARYDPPRQGSRVEIDDRHYRAIKRGWYGQTGTITAAAYCFGTKAGRYCAGCNRTWNAWNVTCPRCGAPTRPA